MDIEKTYNRLIEKIDASKVLRNEPMSNHTSFKIGGKVDIFVKAETLEEVKFVQKIAKCENIPLYIIGNGSNILVMDEGIRGIVLMIAIMRYIH